MSLRFTKFILKKDVNGGVFRAGGELKLYPDSYDYEICDLCGNKRKCYWIENLDDYNRSHWIGFDCCRACLKEYADPCDNEGGEE